MVSHLTRKAVLAAASLVLLLGIESSPASAFIDGPDALAMSPDGARLYVANNIFNTIAVIDTATDQIAATVRLDPRVPVVMEGMAISPDGSRLYVSAIDIRRAYTGPIPPPDPFGPLPDTVSVIDTTSLKLLDRVKVGQWPMGLAISPNGKRVYVANFESGSVSVIDTATNRVTTTAQVGGRPMYLAVSTDGARLYVGNSDGENEWLPVLDTATLDVTRMIETEIYPSEVAADPSGKWVYVTGCCAPSSEIDVIDSRTNQRVAPVRVDGSPMDIAFSPNGSRAYVSLSTSPFTVAVIDTTAGQVISRVSAGPNGLGTHLVMRPDGKRLYTADLGGGTVSVIDTGTDQVATTIRVYLPPTISGQ